MAFTARSHAAREAILAAARRQFTSDGYQRTTIRSVAAEAGVDPSMVMRYYGNKDGLFSAAVDVDLRLPPRGDVPAESFGTILARHFVHIWEGEPAGETIMILLRSAVTTPSAAERIRAIFAEQVIPLARAATGNASDADARAGLITSQLLGIALGRYILQLPPMTAMPADDLVAAIAPVLQRFLTAPLTVAELNLANSR